MVNELEQSFLTPAEMQNEPKQIYLRWIFIFSDSDSEYAQYTRLSNFLSSQR